MGYILDLQAMDTAEHLEDINPSHAQPSVLSLADVCVNNSTVSLLTCNN
jgi:hypothetical protein